MSPNSIPPHAPSTLNQEAIARLVRDFYGDVLKDELLGPVFRAEIGEHWDAHLQRMVDFWCTVMLGSKCFRGNLVHRHMQLRGVTPAHFNAWIQLWTQHTQHRFDSASTYKLRRVAHDIGRQLFSSYFNGREHQAPANPPGPSVHKHADGGRKAS